MQIEFGFQLLTLLVAAWLVRRAWRRLQLSFAKHPSLRGHLRMARRVANLVPYYRYDEARFFTSDGAPAEVASRRRAGFEALSRRLRERAPSSVARSAALEPHVSDLQLTSAYRVPFQYRERVQAQLPLPVMVSESQGNELIDLDGNRYHDLTGAYGVNLLGHDFYKACIDEGVAQARALGPVLGPYHPVVEDNVRRLRAISGMDEVSFHMSGTEAVMQAVALARFHTGRSHLVRFTGAYHGWWDGVQPGPGNPRPTPDAYTLKDMSEATLRVLRDRDDIACVLVNPIQAMHPDASPPGDATLLTSERRAGFDREAYTRWLQALRQVCSERSIVLIVDEIFVGFRLAWGGAQEYFGVRADMVTYGKTLGGGLPVGVVCGHHHLMRRFVPERPSRLCFARGTFNAHPYVMATMNAFLRRMDDPAVRPDYAALDRRWQARARGLNARLEVAGVPVRVAAMSSIFTILYTVPCRYNWMLQYYMRDRGLWLSWVGSGRLIFPHDCDDRTFTTICDRLLEAAEAMHADGWWWQDASLTDRDIRRRILRELLAVRLGLASAQTRGDTASPLTH